MSVRSNIVPLFTPIKFRDVLFENRIGMSPLCMYSAVDGIPNDFHLVNIGTRMNGIGMIVVEATAIESIGRISPADLGIYNDEQTAHHKRIVDFVHSNSRAKIGVQLAHAGRKASRASPWGTEIPNAYIKPEHGGWQVVSSSPNPLSPDSPTNPLTTEQAYEMIKETWPRAVQRADYAGYDFIELHFAHGYLAHQFLSPKINTIRTDEFGGQSFEKRTRFPLEILRSVRNVWPENKPIFVRISADDWEEGGWSLHDSVKFAKVIKEEELADAIDCSGGVGGQLKNPGPGFQVPYASQIRKEAGIATFSVGLITEYEQANSIIADGHDDLVLLGRQLLREPNFALNAAQHFSQWQDWPGQHGYAVSPKTHRGLKRREDQFSKAELLRFKTSNITPLSKL